MAKNSPTTTVDPDHQQVQLIWVHATDLVPSDDNLRGTLTDISDLADSIDAVGILEPLSVTAIDGHAGPWRIVAGHRRHAAVQSLIEAGRWPKSRRLPCTIGAVAAGDEARVVAQLVENLQRVDLDPIDEANGYRRLVEHGWANTRIATATGRNKDRVAARLKLLNLPAGWQTQLRAGDITLDHAHRLASAPVEVITKLAARPAPAQYALEQAIADHKTVQARTLVQQVCKTRGLTLHNGSQWQLERDHDQVAKTTPTGLAKVLLPDAAALKVVIRPVYPGPSKFEVYVYAPQAATAATTATAHPVELTPVQEWQETCNQLHRDHRDALAAWEQSCKEFLVSWAPTVTAEQVAAAAIHDALDAYEDQIEDAAVLTGWHRPPADLDTDIAMAAFREWFAVPRNRTTTMALFFADLTGNPLNEAARAACDLAGLNRPEDPELPPRPDDPADGDGDVDEDLVAVAADGEEWDDGEPNPYAVDPDDDEDDQVVFVVDDEGGEGE